MTATARGVFGAIAILTVLVSRAGADERTLVLRPERTSVTFVLKATGHEVHGVLPVRAASLRVDTDTGAAAGSVTLDARGARTGNSMRDREMHERVLETERFPVITFTPTRLEGALAPDRTSDVTLHGTVTLHGAEHALALPVKVRRAAQTIVAESTFDVPYVAWGLHDPSVLILRVAKVVSITVTVEGELR